MWPHARARMIEPMSGASGSQGPTLGDLENTVRDFWSSRPRRPRHGRKIAGVAAAVGNRYGIDPVIVRAALVVATVVGGFGVLLYLLGWLFLPQEGDETSGIEALFGRGRSSMPSALTIGLCIALIPVAGGTMGGMWFHGGGFIVLALLAAGFYLLHRNRGQLSRPVASATDFSAGAPAFFHAEPTSGTSGQAPQHPETPTGDTPVAQDAQAAPPAWDPLGAAPFAWDLPDPAPVSAPPEPRAPRPRSKVGPATVGLALLVAGTGAVLNIAGVGWFTPPHIIGLALTVLGLGMVVGAFVRGGRGLVVLAVPLALAGLILTAMPFSELDRGGWDDIRQTPLRADQVLPSYAATGGRIELDLTKVAPSETPIVTDISTTMGEAVVIVPDSADVTYTCETTMGSVDCLGDEQAGHGGGPVSGTDLGREPGGQEIQLTVSSTMGSVEVRRG